MKKFRKPSSSGYSYEHSILIVFCRCSDYLPYRMIRAGFQTSAFVARKCLASTTVLTQHSHKPYLSAPCSQRPAVSEYSTLSEHNKWHESGRSNAGFLTASASILVGGALLYKYLQDEPAACKKNVRLEPGSVIKNLPTYTADDVKKHSDVKSGIWVRVIINLFRWLPVTVFN